MGQLYGEESFHTSSGKSACLVASQKCPYTNACSMGSKKEELEVCVQLQGYDLVGSQRCGRLAQVAGTL